MPFIIHEAREKMELQRVHREHLPGNLGRNVIFDAALGDYRHFTSDGENESKAL